MTARDRSPIWIGLADLLLCMLSVTIVAAHPKSEREGGVKEKAEYLITMDSSVDEDADPDLWLIPPSKKPLFYASRDVGCAKLDGDPRGFIDSRITLADGSTVKVDSEKETVSLRCIEPGRYDLAANLYAYRKDGINRTEANGLGLKVHVEIIKLNPTVEVAFSRDLVLDRVGQTINWASFDLDRAGKITLVDPPLAPITAAYQKRDGQ